MKKILILLALMALSISALGGCGGTGAGSADSPPGENPGVPSIVQLSPSHFIAQTNASITLHAKVLDGNGVPVQNVPVTFTNLSEPFGVISSALKSLGIIKPKIIMSTTVKNTDINGIATVSIRSTIDGFATIQAEVNNGVGFVRDKKTVLFSSTFNLPLFSFAPQLFLDVDTNASFTSPDEPSDFILFKTAGDNQRYIRATVLFDSSIGGKIITFGSDSTDVTYPNGANEIAVVADSNGQATVLATVNPSALSQVTRTINITAVAADGASNILTLFLEPVVIDTSASSLSAFPTTVAVNGTSTITATVKIITGGFAPDGTTVNFTATCGTVDPFAQTTDGIANATFTAPATVPSGGVCTVSGKVAGVTIGSANITITAALAVQPGTQTANGITGDSKTYTISGGTAPYSVASDDPTLPAPSLGATTFTQVVPAGTSARTVTYTVTDSVGSSVAATLKIIGPTSLQILPPVASVVSSGSITPVTFAISGGTPPYITTSSDSSKAFDTVVGDGIWNGSPITVNFAPNPAAGSVTLNVFDSLGATTTATITILGPAPAALLISPNIVSVVSSGIAQTIAFTISGGTAPYVTTSTDPSRVFDSVSGDGIWNVAALTANIPAGVAAGSVTLNVLDAVGGTATATITILAAGSGSVLNLNPATISVTGLSTAADSTTFTITGGIANYAMTSSNTAVVPNVAVPAGGPPQTFTVNPLPVAASTAVTITVVDSTGATDTSVITVTPFSPSLAINPSTIAVDTGTIMTFTIIGGFGPFTVYTSDSGVVSLASNPITVTPPTVTFTATAVADGSATITVVDSDGKTVTAAVTVNAPAVLPTPDFAIGCAPAALNVPLTGSNTTSCSVTSLNGFSAPVALSLVGPVPPGMTFAFLPASPLTPPANLTTSTVLTITDAAVAPGVYPIFLLGQSGILSHTTLITVTVP